MAKKNFRNCSECGLTCPDNSLSGTLIARESHDGTKGVYWVAKPNLAYVFGTRTMHWSRKSRKIQMEYG